MIPAVTYHEDADITDLEAFRVAINKENEKSGLKITMLAFLIKACTVALKKFPGIQQLARWRQPGAEEVFQHRFRCRHAERPGRAGGQERRPESVAEIAVESGELAKKARDGKLGPADMSGACFTISSVGGIGGTYFSPIVNAPEVAILGVNKSVMKPVWNGKAIRAAPDPAAVADRRPPRHRRRAGHPFQRLCRATAGRHAARAALIGRRP
jgi:pyruvate dehydrogenase E2 component (dihydrolipoamide acetyltransferase)